MLESDWLLRFYGFKVDELFNGERRNLDIEIDPKLAWALEHRELFPVDVNRAPRELLLRIPGIGVKTVERMIRTRRHTRLTAQDLKRLRVAWNRASLFVVAADHVPKSLELEAERLRDRFVAPPQPERQTQLTLFT